mmetsp:Transcript_23129/g.87525  ORF Transcript_23129/g.87525 Transcript_23129/m.87525 type:complete len:307 (-) Transcript_23129:520-1440(-)
MVVPKCGRSPFCWAFRVEDDSRQPSRSRSFPGQLPVAAPPAPSCSSLRPSATAALGRSGHAMAGRAVRSGPWHAVAAPQVAKRLPSRQGSRGTASGPQSPGKRVGSLVREPLAGAQHNGGKSRVVGGVRQVLRFEAKRAVLAHADAPLLGQKVGRVKLHARLGGSNRHGPTGPGVRQDGNGGLLPDAHGCTCGGRRLLVRHAAPAKAVVIPWLRASRHFVETGTQRHTPRRGKVHCPLGRHHAASGDQVLVCLHKVAAAKPQSVVCHAVASVISAAKVPVGVVAQVQHGRAPGHGSLKGDSELIGA